jgi:hypothetical protein
MMEFPGVPDIRLDFALVNAQLRAAAPDLSCLIRKDRLTDTLSDHYPVVCQWSVQ